MWIQVGHLHGTDLGEGHTSISVVVGLLARVGVLPQLGLGAEEIQGILGDDEKHLLTASEQDDEEDGQLQSAKEGDKESCVVGNGEKIAESSRENQQDTDSPCMVKALGA